MSAGQKIIDGLKDAVAGNFSRVHIPDGTGKMQTWYRVDAEGGALLTGNVDDRCPGCGARLGDLPDDPVNIPRPQYEALIALPDALRNTLSMLEAAHRQLGMYTKDNPRIVKARAALIEAQRALRATGLMEEKE